jgi:hypothetical protein
MKVNGERFACVSLEREARGVGRVAGHPEVPARGNVDGLSTRSIDFALCHRGALW